jgi:hypothetical protein
MGGLLLAAEDALGADHGFGAQGDQQGEPLLQGERSPDAVRDLQPGFPHGRQQRGRELRLLPARRAADLQPGHARQLRGRVEIRPPERTHDLERRLLLHAVEGLPGADLRRVDLSDHLQCELRRRAGVWSRVEHRHPDHAGADLRVLGQLQRFAPDHGQAELHRRAHGHDRAR